MLCFTEGGFLCFAVTRPGSGRRAWHCWYRVYTHRAYLLARFVCTLDGGRGGAGDAGVESLESNPTLV